MHKRLNVVGSYGTEQIRKNSNKRNFRQNESFFFFTFSKFQGVLVTFFALQKVAHFGTKFHLAKYCSRTVIFSFQPLGQFFFQLPKISLIYSKSLCFHEKITRREGKCNSSKLVFAFWERKS